MILNDPPVDPRCHSCSWEPLIAAGFGLPDSSPYRNVHSNGLKFYILFFLPVFFLPLFHFGAPAPPLSLSPSLHSLCPWDTPFIYFLLNFSALQDSFPLSGPFLRFLVEQSARWEFPRDWQGSRMMLGGAKVGGGLVWDGERGKDGHFGSVLYAGIFLRIILLSIQEWSGKIVPPSTIFIFFLFE